MSSLCPTCDPKFVPLEEYLDEELPSKLRCGRSHVEPREREKILTGLNFAERQLEIYEQEIHKQQLKIDFLLSQKRRLEYHISGSRSLFSPIRRLPPEVLVVIFEEVDEGRGISVFQTNPDSYYHQVEVPILNASHVCADWRRIVFTTKAIWSRISVVHDISSKFFLLSEGTLSLLEYIMMTASSSWINIELNAPLFPKHYPQLKANESALMLFERLRKTCHLWESLSIRPQVLELPYFNEILPHLTRLRKLAIHADWFSSDQLDHRFSNLKELPSLTHLYLNLWEWTNADDLRLKAPLHVPWTQLTTLKCKLANVYNIYLLLSQALNLLHMYIQIETTAPSMTRDAVHSAIQALRLQTFMIHISVPQFLPQIFQWLTLPSLVDMSITFGKYEVQRPELDGAAIVREFQHMQKRSAFSLSSFSLIAIQLAFPEIVDLVSSLPSLISLRLFEITDHSFMIAPFLARLTIPSQSSTSFAQQNTILLPQLQTLYLRPCSYHRSQKSILEMVKSRQQHSGNVALKKLVVKTNEEIEDKVMEEFRQLEDINKDISIKFLKPKQPGHFRFGCLDQDCFPTSIM